VQNVQNVKHTCRLIKHAVLQQTAWPASRSIKHLIYYVLVMRGAFIFSNKNTPFHNFIFVIFIKRVILNYSHINYFATVRYRLYLIIFLSVTL